MAVRLESAHAIIDLQSAKYNWMRCCRGWREWSDNHDFSLDQAVYEAYHYATTIRSTTNESLW